YLTVHTPCSSATLKRSRSATTSRRCFTRTAITASSSHWHAKAMHRLPSWSAGARERDLSSRTDEKQLRTRRLRSVFIEPRGRKDRAGLRARYCTLGRDADHVARNGRAMGEG